MTQNEALACIIMYIEQKKIPYFLITQIEILNTDQENILNTNVESLLKWIQSDQYGIVQKNQFIGIGNKTKR